MCPLPSSCGNEHAFKGLGNTEKPPGLRYEN